MAIRQAFYVLPKEMDNLSIFFTKTFRHKHVWGNFNIIIINYIK